MHFSEICVLFVSEKQTLSNFEEFSPRITSGATPKIIFGRRLQIQILRSVLKEFIRDHFQIPLGIHLEFPTDSPKDWSENVD